MYIFLQYLVMEQLDGIQLNFSEGNMLFMNICLAFIMFGVSLEIKLDHFKQVVNHPQALFTGIFSQFIFLPVATLGLVWILRPTPSLALGMFLLAAVPGGNISNFMSHLARGNTALSVSLTAFSSAFSILMTPLNFAFWAALYPPTHDILKTIALDPVEVFKIIALLLIIPLVVGIGFAYRFPKFTAAIVKPIKNLSMLIFIGFVVFAFRANYNIFLQVIQYVVIIVLIHHTVALTGGYQIAKLMKFDVPTRRSIAIETSIQNSGLGLILIFNFFDGLGGMAVLAAWWSIWHIAVGLSISYFWSRHAPTPAIPS